MYWYPVTASLLCLLLMDYPEFIPNWIAMIVYSLASNNNILTILHTAHHIIIVARFFILSVIVGLGILRTQFFRISLLLACWEISVNIDSCIINVRQNSCPILSCSEAISECNSSLSRYTGQIVKHMFELLLINARESRILLPREYIEVNLSSKRPIRSAFAIGIPFLAILQNSCYVVATRYEGCHHFFQVAPALNSITWTYI